MALMWYVVLAAAAVLGPWSHAPDSTDVAAQQNTPVAHTVINQDAKEL